MIKMRYNIAKNKKVDYLKLSLFSLILLVISALFIFIGVSRFSASRKKFQMEINKLDLYKAKLRSLGKKSKEYKNDIKKIESEWKKKVNLANRLILYKSFSYIKNLNFLEKLLPIGVYISNISLSNSSKSIINFNIVANSYSKLLETYKVFSNYQLKIRGQTESDIFFKASLSIRIKDEKK